MKKKGIEHQKFVAYTPEQNGSAEREIGTLFEFWDLRYKLKILVKFCGLTQLHHVVYVLNIIGPSSIKKNNKSLFELWYGKVPNINSQCLKVFGTEIFANVAKQKIMKWEVKSKRGVFIGFDYNVKGCRIYFEKERKIGIYRDVIFCNTFWR